MIDADVRKAVLLNDLRSLQNLLKDGVDVNQLDSNGTSLIHLAAFFGFEQIVSALIEARARPDVRDNEWVTPLQRACYNDNPVIVQYLLASGANAANSSKSFLSPLHVCAQENSCCCAEVLLENNPAVIDRTDDGGCSPLHYAVYHGNGVFVDLLLRSKANVNLKNKMGLTAAHWAAFKGESEILKKFFDNGLDFEVHDHDLRTILHYAAMSGNVDAVNCILKREIISINCQCTRGFSPLHYAVIGGHSQIVELLLTQGADKLLSSNSEGLTPLHIAAGQTDGIMCCDRLLSEDYDHAHRSKDGSTAMHYACAYGRIACVKTFIAKSLPVNSKRSFGITPLHIAARYGHDLIVKNLVAAGAYVEAITESGHTPLHLAAFHGYLDVVRTLCVNGSQVNAIDKLGRTPLHVAVQSASLNRTLVVDCLMSNDTIILSVDNRGRSAVHYAAKNGFSKILRKLLTIEGAVSVQDDIGFTPLHYTVQLADELCLMSSALLLGADSSCSGKRDNKGYLPVHHAVKAGNLDIAAVLLDVFIDGLPTLTVPSSLEPHHLTLFHLAARYNHVELLQKLLLIFRKRINKNVLKGKLIISNIGLELDANKRTPMHYAMYHGNVQCVELLSKSPLGRKAFLQKDLNQMSPLHAAAAAGRFDCLGIALAVVNKKDVNVLDSLNRIPIMYALSNGFFDCALLLQPNSDIILCDLLGRNLMHRVCSMKNEIICTQLIEKFESIEEDFALPDINGVSPLHIAARTGDVSAIKYITGKEVKEEPDNDGFLPSDWAAACGQIEALQVLIDANRNVDRQKTFIVAVSCEHIEICEYMLKLDPAYANAVDVYQRSALHHAVRCGSFKIARLLVSYKANLNAKDCVGITPLMMSSYCWKIENGIAIIDMLMRRGARLEARDIVGNTALHHACFQANQKILRRLIDLTKPFPVANHKSHLINCMNKQRETVLHLACRAGMLSSVNQILTASPFSLTLMDSKGRIPLVAPVENEHVYDCMLHILDHFMEIATTFEFLVASRHHRAIQKIANSKEDEFDAEYY